MGGKDKERGPREGDVWTRIFVIQMTTAVSIVNLEIPSGLPELQPFSKEIAGQSKGTSKAKPELNKYPLIGHPGQVAKFQILAIMQSHKWSLCWVTYIQNLF